MFPKKLSEHWQRFDFPFISSGTFSCVNRAIKAIQEREHFLLR